MRATRSLRIAFPAVLLLIAASLTACSASAVDADGIIRVPAEAATLTEAEQRAQPGDLILVAPGTYNEQMLISTPDITVRGEDRNTTIIDGGGVRPFGIVAIADGVRVENLTVANANFYGLLFTGLHDETGPKAPTATGYEAWDPAKFPPLQRFRADHVTAINNGLYGIYAFNSQNGVILDSYASGSADSGLYIGQCGNCGILVTGNVAERNAVGFENSNASDSVIVVGNRFSGNRVGLTLLSSYQEAFLPQKRNLIVGNLISDNVESQTPSQASGSFGTGIGISGGVGNQIERNTITGNTRAGVVLTNSEDVAAVGNALIGNIFANNRVDIANTSAARAATSATCVDAAVTTEPAELASQVQSVECTATEQAGTAQASASTLGGPGAPAGISFTKVAWPKPQPNLAQAKSYPVLPDTITMPDTAGVAAPSADLLIEVTGTR